MPDQRIIISILEGQGYDVYDALVEECIQERGGSLSETGLSLETGFREYDLRGTKSQLAYIAERLRAAGATVQATQDGNKIPSTNLRIQKPSRKPVQPGDVFTMQLPSGRYLFGRVVSTTMRIGPLENVVLIYVYQYQSFAKQPPDRSMLCPQKLLIPPAGINTLPWRRGYFETIAHWPLTKEDMLRQHCFWDNLRKRYLDEMGNKLRKRTEPCGEFGLNSYRTIDDEISKALGLALAPD